MSGEDNLGAYEMLQNTIKAIEEDYKTATYIYGKIAESHDYKDMAKVANNVMNAVKESLDRAKAKRAQMEAHMKSQETYQELKRFEGLIADLVKKYLN